MRNMDKWLIIMMCLCVVTFSLKANFLEIECNKALKEKKLILLTIKKEGCPYCLKMQKEIFEVPQYEEQIAKKYLHVTIYQDDPIFPKILYVKYFPTNLILSPQDLHIIDEFPGYMNPDFFIELLDEIYAYEFKVSYPKNYK